MSVFLSTRTKFHLRLIVLHPMNKLDVTDSELEEVDDSPLSVRGLSSPKRSSSRIRSGRSYFVSVHLTLNLATKKTTLNWLFPHHLPLEYVFAMMTHGMTTTLNIWLSVATKSACPC